MIPIHCHEENHGWRGKGFPIPTIELVDGQVIRDSVTIVDHFEA